MRSPDHVLSSSELQEMLGADVMPLFRLLFAQMAASCAALACALREAASGKRVRSSSHFFTCNCSWSAHAKGCLCGCLLLARTKSVS